MPEKSVREMSARERRGHSLAARVWRSLIMSSVILAVAAILVGLASHGYALLNQHLAVAYNYAAVTAELLENEIDVVALSENVTEIYRSLPDEEHAAQDTLRYREHFFGASNESTSDYYRALSILRRLMNDADIEYIYLGMFDPETDSLVYMVDPDQSDSSEMGKWEPVDPEEVHAFLDWSGEGYPSYIGWTRQYGWLGTCGAPVANEDGETVAFLFADVSIRSIATQLLAYAAQFSIVMLVLIIVAANLITRHFQDTLVAPINQIAEAAESYTEDRERGSDAVDHFAKLDIHTGDEVENLALIMSDMEHGLAEYEANLERVNAERGRIGAELNLASTLQSRMIPNVFPPFPDRTEFDIYAAMKPAREVGGDFYDFFFIDDDHLALVIADVSGKGVPSALFMMMTKILINDHAMLGGTPAQILTDVNRAVCANNPVDMFVTVWLGILEVSTGRLTAANAGHEHPIVQDGHGRFETLRDRHGFVLGGDVDTVYHDCELTLEPGGSIFVHTDGITEAKGGSGELFGSKRLLASLNGHQDGASDEIIGGVLADVEQFVGDSPQFDDITMLCLHYRGPERSKSEGEHMAVMTIDATVENIEAVTEFVNEHLEKLCCPPKAQMQIDIAIDELFSNISLYAYAPDTGPATVCVDVEENPLSVILTFIDNGKPFDPLSTDDPDVTLPAEKREIGGLGVFLVKKTMDSIDYEYKDGQNILRIKKAI